MDRIPSAEFRRTYARLEQPVEVTVNGHVIGTYWPYMAATNQPSPVPARDYGTFGHSQPAPKPRK